ncbi:hypothetical protein [Emticicia sp. C21]|uniref:hypothetical protein n=1 Tax=Emticicia sp. C21 TaxID=2302915 RepID=UPI000E3467F8|nr:hypothetical protein [Emticicia sp. C21]RFS15013.1 hypothetical protein D0T08_18200 [Emticicia sp. C21]
MKITRSLALNILLGLFSLVIVFHLCIITQLIPYTIVWAGKLNSVEEMYLFEAVSIAINVFFVTVLLLKARYIKHTIPERLLNIILWMFLILFVLNTVGNLMAKTAFERLVFTPMTLLTACLLWLIVRK